ncbi:LamG-like jellyroll fold domain-containing protein [Roseibacillus persicicus]|uniref:LamG-like jellyroll fold domain-containing protein n=1 Tax=Roseibacillus persicicus TaxID=454148 RepID=UPI0028105DED|nr:LamG-like jellyroll fold domain-containing protein [Roseibacillus persicicus]MDQ8189144.1 choice-of-anchor Q domain-containing protein [Roseibacillus persicicus]
MNTFKSLSASLLILILGLVFVFFPKKNHPQPPQADEQSGSFSLRVSHGTARPADSLAMIRFDEWMQSQLAKPVQDIDLTEARPLAEARGAAMAELIQREPAAALKAALSWQEWLSLPEELQALVEQPFSLRGEYAVYSGCGDNEGRHRHWFQSGEEALRVFPTASWRDVITKHDLPVQGIRVGEVATFFPGPIQILSETDREAVMEHFPLRDEGGVPVALLGGELLAANETKIKEVAADLEQALGMIGPHTVNAGLAVAFSSGASNGGGVIGAASQASLDWSATPKRVIVIRCDFSDLSGEALSAATASDYLEICSDWVADNSYGKSSLINRTVTSEVIRLPKTTAEYAALGNSKSGTLATDARAAALAAGYAVNDFDFVVYAYRTNSNIGAGFASIGGRDQWEGVTSENTYMHEFGHNYGLGHANFWVRNQAGGDWNEVRGVNTSLGAAGNDEYGDVFDLMAVHYRQRPGIENVWPSGHFAMSSKKILGWIEDSRVEEVTKTSTYRIYRFDHPDTNPNQKVGLTFLTGQGKRIWAGLRRNFPSNHTLSTGAYMVWQHSDRNHRQIDCTPFSQIDGILEDNYDHADFDRDDSALAEGASWTSPDGSVRVTNTGLGGISPNEYLDLRIEFLKANANHVTLSTDPNGESPGLTGSYFNERLRATNSLDWNTTSTPSGTRVDPSITFRENDFGDRAALGITGGSDTDWSHFSVQWDGYLHVPHGTEQTLRLISDDGTKLWIDLDSDGTLGSTADELVIDNSFGLSSYTVPIPAGSYQMRLQYEEAAGRNYCVLEFGDQGSKGSGDFELYQEATLENRGLTASFVNSSLRNNTSQSDWRTSQTISGTRTEAMPLYWDNTMGTASSMGISSNSYSHWINYSVQYDGWIKVLRRTRFLTYGADGTRFWIDSNNDGSFASTAPEYHSGNWGENGKARYSPISDWIDPGVYRLRIQREQDSDSGNRWAFMGQPEASLNSASALKLQGDGHATALPGATISGNFTVEAWIRPDDISGSKTFFSTRTMTSNYGTTLKVRDGTEFIGHLGDAVEWKESGASVTQTYRAGEWIHVAYAVSPSDYSIYLNGSLAASGPLSGPAVLTDPNHPVSIGRDGMFGENFVGLIDELRIWDVTRTGEQIASTLRRSISAHTPGLESYWRMDTIAANGSLPDLKGAREATILGDNSDLTVSPGPIAGDDHGNDSTFASLLLPDIGVLRHGKIEEGNDQDWFEISVAESGTLEVWTTGNLDSKGTLYDGSTNEILATHDDINGSQDRNFRLVQELTPGSYYLMVNSAGTHTGDYLLHSNFHPGGLPFAFAQPVLAPGDAIIPIGLFDGRSSSSPEDGQNDAEKAIDRRLDTKYLNFGREYSGFIVTPRAQPAVVRGLVMATAIDEEGFDPVGWELFGTNDLITSTAHSEGLEERWSLISTSTTTLPSARATVGSLNIFENSTPYSSYKLLITNIKDPRLSAMQIGEVQFVTAIDLPPTQVTSLADSGEGSLREVISTLPEGEPITFDPSLSGGVLRFESGQIAIGHRQITIDASMLSEGLTLQANESARLFELNSESSLSLNGVNVTGANLPEFFSGGAIWMFGGNLTIENAAFYGNQASEGGAIYAMGASNLTIRNTTFAHNQATTFGGAVRLIGTSEGLFENCTFSANRAGTDGGGLSSGGNVTIRNTIIAGNHAEFGNADNFHHSGTETYEGANLIDVDALLAPLGFYGGSTPSMPPETNSLAINGATGSSIPTHDQNGFARHGGADIGATEHRPLSILAFDKEPEFDPANPHYDLAAWIPPGPVCVVELSEDLQVFEPDTNAQTHFLGSEPDVAIWRLPLSQQRVFLRVAQYSTFINGLRAYWNFEGDATNSLYAHGDVAAGERLNGVALGDTSFVESGILGEAAFFDGNGDYVSVSGEIVEDAPDGSYSISAWFNPSIVPEGSTRMMVYETTPSYAISLGLREGSNSEDTQIQFFTQSSDADKIINYPVADNTLAGRLFHSLLTFDASTGKIVAYINGVEIGEAQNNGEIADFSGLNIGTYRNATGRWFHGAIDEIAVWNRVLSPTEVTLLYNGGQPTPLTP